ncbi:MAG: YigZ family protein [Lachnospiraceae bacterium]|nr:YigZ family protein [Lachnospiraceae bacterium]
MSEEKQICETYKMLEEGGQGEIEEKKSRFIATVRPVKTEEEAAAFIEEMKKKYWDARHNCSAYVIGSRAEMTRCSDDGEPSGTAGRPMLEVLLGSGIRDVAVVVTRYFGGTLLGTGGLVRAYTQAVQAGIAACEVAVMTYGALLRLQTDYNGIGKIQYLCAQRNIQIKNSEYTQDVIVDVLVTEEQKDAFIKELTEATNGRIKIDELEKLYFKKKIS